MPAEAPAVPHNRDFLQLSNDVGLEGRGRAQAGPVLLWMSQIPVSSLSWQPVCPCVTAVTTGLAEPSAAECG